MGITGRHKPSCTTKVLNFGFVVILAQAGSRGGRRSRAAEGGGLAGVACGGPLRSPGGVGKACDRWWVVTGSEISRFADGAEPSNTDVLRFSGETGSGGGATFEGGGCDSEAWGCDSESHP